MKHFFPVPVLVLPLLFGLACGPDSDTDGDTDGGTDGGTPTVLCADLTAPGATLTLDPDGPSTQIYVATAFAGEQIFVAYSGASPSENFVIRGRRLSCDGTLVGDAFQISETSTFDCFNTAVAGQDGRFLVAWHGDTGASPFNLDTFHRTYAADGTAITAATELAALRKGIVNVQNAWLPSVAADPTGGFAMVGSWGHADATAFQTYGQHLDADGALSGESFDWNLQPTAGQLYPSASVDGNGDLIAAWQEDAASSTQITWGRLLSGSSTPEASSVVPASNGGTLPRLSSHGDETWLVFQSATGPVVRVPDGTLLSLGGQGDSNPVVAAHEGGALVAWYRSVAGLTSAVHYRWVSSSGSQSGGGEVGTTTAMAAYPLSLTSLGDGRFFLAWQEGANPDFRVRGRFITP